MQQRSRLSTADQIARIANGEVHRVLSKQGGVVRVTNSRVLGAGTVGDKSTGAGAGAAGNTTSIIVRFDGNTVSAKRLVIGGGLAASSDGARADKVVIHSVAMFDPVRLLLQ